MNNNSIISVIDKYQGVGASAVAEEILKGSGSPGMDGFRDMAGQRGAEIYTCYSYILLWLNNINHMNVRLKSVLWYVVFIIIWDI